MEHPISPFCPGASTFLIAAGLAASAGIQAPGDTEGIVTVLFWNGGTDDAFIGYGPDAATAQANALIPTVPSPSSVIVVPARSMVSYSLKAKSWYSGIVATTASNVWATQGAGS